MKRVKWVKSPVQFGYAYKKGGKVDIDDDLAESLVDKGAVTIIGTAAVKYDSPASVAELPFDVPFREDLLVAGITIFEQLKEIKDYRKIKGIGPAKAKAIDNYFSKTIHTR